MTDDFGPEPHETVEQAADTLKDVKEELLEERAKESQNRRWINQIGLSTGILSALAAITSMQAGYLANEGMLAQIRATDQWALYQARGTKRHLDESTVAILQALQKPVSPAVTAEIAKLKQGQDDSQAEAHKLETEASVNLQQHESFAHSVAALQIGISLGAVAALLRQRRVWYLGLGIAAVGVGFMIWGAYPSHGSKASLPTATSVALLTETVN